MTVTVVKVRAVLVASKMVCAPAYVKATVPPLVNDEGVEIARQSAAEFIVCTPVVMVTVEPFLKLI